MKNTDRTLQLVNGGFQLSFGVKPHVSNGWAKKDLLFFCFSEPWLKPTHTSPKYIAPARRFRALPTRRLGHGHGLQGEALEHQRREDGAQRQQRLGARQRRPGELRKERRAMDPRRSVLIKRGVAKKPQQKHKPHPSWGLLPVNLPPFDPAAKPRNATQRRRKFAEKNGGKYKPGLPVSSSPAKSEQPFSGLNSETTTKH